MNRILIICYILLFHTTINAQNINVLFLGNSYTSVNNLPGTIEALLEGSDKTMTYASNTPGGCCYFEHVTNSTSLNLIRRGDWDYVVLQEQSQMPSIDYYRYNSMYPAAAQLRDSIMRYNPCAEVVFYMTWGRRDGGQQCEDYGEGTYCSADFRDFDHMQDTMTRAYCEIAEILQSRVAPVGEAWRNAIHTSDINLFSNDGSHPTVHGTYLTACTFYTTFWNESPIGLPHPATITDREALLLQKAAHQVMETENGTESNPFLIANKADLIAFQQGINTGNAFSYHGGNVNAMGEGQFFKLTNDIVFNTMAFHEDGTWEGNHAPDDWTPIGFFDYNTWDFIAFTGTLDGDGHAISGLYHNAPAAEYVGLFGVLMGGTVKNLRVAASYFCGREYVGSIAGDAEGKFIDTGVFRNAQILHCVNDGIVSGQMEVGGIGGMMCWADLIGCINLGRVIGGESCGGLAGFFRDPTSTVQHCLNGGKVSGNNYIGGVIGLIDHAQMNFCLNVGQLDGKVFDTVYFGGIVGGNALEGSFLTSCYYDKQICTAELGIGTNDTCVNMGMLTRQLTNGSLFQSTEWDEAEGFYPTPAQLIASSAVSEVATLASLPIFLFADEESYETVEHVTRHFTLTPHELVTWQSQNGYLTIEDDMVSFDVTNTTDFLCATLRNTTRSIELLLDYQPTSVGESGTLNAQIFPNPCKGILNIEAEGMNSYSLFDATGRCLKQGSCTDARFAIDMRQFGSGLYLLMMKGKDRSFTQRIVVE